MHTLNGTAVTDRWLLAILENFQDEGGKVAVPECLVEFGAPQRLEQRLVQRRPASSRSRCVSIVAEA